MEEVLEVYQRAPDPQRPVVCRDETFRPLVGEVRAPLPVQSGAVERYDSVYGRNGVASVFLAFEPLAGWRHVAVTDTRKRGDWAHFVRHLVDEQYRDAEQVVLVMDQLNTPSAASFYEAFPPEEARRLAGRLEIHHTPQHGSWLNRAEIEFSVLAWRATCPSVSLTAPHGNSGLLPGNSAVIGRASRPIGSSPPPTPASNYGSSTRQSRADRLLEGCFEVFL
jgi:DDE superfamily endonuclease